MNGKQGAEGSWVPPREPDAASPPRRSKHAGFRNVGGLRDKLSLGRLQGLPLAHWLPAVPWLLAGAVVVWQLAGALLNTVGLILVFIGWLASGVLAWWPPFESFLARVALRLRSPTVAERAVVRPAWAAVRQRAGRSADGYRLWISDADELNATASVGRTVAVTRQVLELPPRSLAAVLAHELGHHLERHSAMSLLVYWYSLPARIFLWLLSVAWQVAVRLLALIVQVARPLAALIGAGGRGGGPMSALVGSILGAVVLFALLVVPVLGLLYAVQRYPWLLLIAALPPLAAALERAEEYRSDRVACNLGFGRDLVDVLRRVEPRRHDAEVSWRQRLLATHPPVETRARRLEQYLAARDVSAGESQQPPYT
jgi:Zn-dependent protease with chaperone function